MNTNEKRMKNFLRAARKRCHLLSKVVELAGHSYNVPHPCPTSSILNYFLSEIEVEEGELYPSAVTMHHDEGLLKRRPLNGSSQTADNVIERCATRWLGDKRNSSSRTIRRTNEDHLGTSLHHLMPLCHRWKSRERSRGRRLSPIFSRGKPEFARGNLFLKYHPLSRKYTRKS